jgi:predicted secreted Zn-dependent protease
MGEINYECLQDDCTRHEKRHGYFGIWYTSKTHPYRSVCPVHKQVWIEYEKDIQEIEEAHERALNTITRIMERELRSDKDAIRKKHFGGSDT